MEGKLRKIFLSFSGMLTDLSLAVIRLEDLEGSLFYFGCARELVMNFQNHLRNSSIEPGTIILGFSLSFPEARKGEFIGILEKIVAVLLQAEKEDRVEWRPHPGRTSFKQLNYLLERNGLEPIDLSQVPRAWKQCTAKRAAIMIKKSGIPLDAMEV